MHLFTTEKKNLFTKFLVFWALIFSTINVYCYIPSDSRLQELSKIQEYLDDDQQELVKYSHDYNRNQYLFKSGSTLTYKNGTSYILNDTYLITIFNKFEQENSSNSSNNNVFISTPTIAEYQFCDTNQQENIIGKTVYSLSSREIEALQYYNLYIGNVVDNSNNHTYLFMNKVEGKTYKQFFESSKNLKEIMTVYRNILYKVSEFHRIFGVAHGDLHGGNIIVKNDLNVQLIDFGESFIIDTKDDKALDTYMLGALLMAIVKTHKLDANLEDHNNRKLMSLALKMLKSSPISDLYLEYLNISDTVLAQLDPLSDFDLSIENCISYISQN